jgi:hypothetical protein
MVTCDETEKQNKARECARNKEPYSYSIFHGPILPHLFIFICFFRFLLLNFVIKTKTKLKLSNEIDTLEFRKKKKTMDGEMMVMETETSSSGQNDAVRDLLTLARQLINQGKPSQALQAVIYLSSSFFIQKLQFLFFFISKFVSNHFY